MVSRHEAGPRLRLERATRPRVRLNRQQIRLTEDVDHSLMVSQYDSRLVVVQVFVPLDGEAPSD